MYIPNLSISKITNLYSGKSEKKIEITIHIFYKNGLMYLLNFKYKSYCQDIKSINMPFLICFDFFSVFVCFCFFFKVNNISITLLILISSKFTNANVGTVLFYLEIYVPTGHHGGSLARHWAHQGATAYLMSSFDPRLRKVWMDVESILLAPPFMLLNY